MCERAFQVDGIATPSTVPFVYPRQGSAATYRLSLVALALGTVGAQTTAKRFGAVARVTLKPIHAVGELAVDQHAIARRDDQGLLLADAVDASRCRSSRIGRA